MFRILNFVSVIALLAAAGAVYHVKYSAAFEAQKIAKLREDIRFERDRIATLGAEWARRTAPERIQTQAEHHLDMQPLDNDHMDVLASLPAKPEANGDALGGMIEALSDGKAGGINGLLGGAAEKGSDKPKPAAKPVANSAPKPVATAAPAAPRPVAVTGNAPLPLSAMPAAGVMAPTRPVFGAGAQGVLGAPVNPVTSRPLLPPGSVGQ
jgi:hypothetical protein